MDELSAKRAEQEDDNVNVRPVDLLNLVIKNLNSGEIKPSGLYIMAIERWDNGNIKTIERYRCGMNRQDEIALLADAQWMALSRWRE